MKLYEMTTLRKKDSKLPVNLFEGGEPASKEDKEKQILLMKLLQEND